MSSEKVLVLGASPKAERYSYKAFKLLLKHGHIPVLVGPGNLEIEGYQCYANIEAALIEHPKIDTVTMYVRPEISSDLSAALIKAHPKRVIFNPGTENPSLSSTLVGQGIEVEEACTLVLLNSAQF